MDHSLTRHEQVMINAGQRGTMVKMASADVVQSLGAAIADLSQAS
jgi:prolyl-tRNA editing enzyme YbaK/EbsC (Cys-tRNA(Pro) deacylase)